jgi:hypothetical protein
MQVAAQRAWFQNDIPTVWRSLYILPIILGRTDRGRSSLLRARQLRSIQNCIGEVRYIVRDMPTDQACQSAACALQQLHTLWGV